MNAINTKVTPTKRKQVALFSSDPNFKRDVATRLDALAIYDVRVSETDDFLKGPPADTRPGIVILDLGNGAVRLVSPTGTGAMSDPAARFALDQVDVRTGRVTQVAGLSDQQTAWGATFATSMLAEPARDFPAPPDPLDPRLAAALAVGVLLLGTVAVLVWRRRVRP